MDGADRIGRWTSIKQRLGLKGMGCCGATWSPSPSTLTIIETLEEEHHHRTEPVSVGPVQAAVPGMNLAMALAAERNSRAGREGPTTASGQVKSLMTLIEEMDGADWSNRRRWNSKGAGDSDWLCCVCMERNKGAAFIPCGHTFCRVCSREMWVNRGTCPLCSRPIVEILDIY